MAFVIKELILNPATEHSYRYLVGKRFDAANKTIVASIEDNTHEDPSGRINTLYTIKDCDERTLSTIENVSVQVIYNENMQISEEQIKSLSGEVVRASFFEGKKKMIVVGLMALSDDEQFIHITEANTGNRYHTTPLALFELGLFKSEDL